ncbi:MAG: 30S ribosomal protein S9 [Candidatus Nealsonbacteria bacterium]
MLTINMPVAKTTRKITKKVKPEIVKEAKALHFFEAVGRRKTAVARVHLQAQDSREFVINGKPLDKYFPAQDLQQIVLSSLEKMDCLGKFSVTARVNGGGLHAQSEALRHGIARALTEFNPEFRARLKKAGFLTRDSRMRERKKFGLKRARRAPQWTKR